MRQNRLLRLPDVIKLTTLSKTEIYRRIQQGRFPRQVKLSPRKSAWRQADIEQWMQELA